MSNLAFTLLQSAVTIEGFTLSQIAVIIGIVVILWALEKVARRWLLPPSEASEYVQSQAHAEETASSKPISMNEEPIILVKTEMPAEKPIEKIAVHETSAVATPKTTLAKVSAVKVATAKARRANKIVPKKKKIKKIVAPVVSKPIAAPVTKPIEAKEPIKKIEAKKEKEKETKKVEVPKPVQTEIIASATPIPALKAKVSPIKKQAKKVVPIAKEKKAPIANPIKVSPVAPVATPTPQKVTVAAKPSPKKKVKTVKKVEKIETKKPVKKKTAETKPVTMKTQTKKETIKEIPAMEEETELKSDTAKAARVRNPGFI